MVLLDKGLGRGLGKERRHAGESVMNKAGVGRNPFGAARDQLDARWHGRRKVENGLVWRETVPRK